MKLQMNDFAKTVITSVKKLSGKDHWNGVYKTMFEDGTVLEYSDRNTQNKDWNKLINKDSGFKMEWRYVETDEDKGIKEGKYNHGSIVYAVMTSEGNGGVFVWDEMRQDVVRESELTV